MSPSPFLKYAFKIKTRLGVVVDNLMIHGRDELEAQRKLRQVYHDCQVIQCTCYQGGVRAPVSTFEDVANLIVR